MFNILKNSNLQQTFAEELARDVAMRYPPALDKAPDKRPSINRLTRIMEDTCQRAAQFQAEHHMGWIGKARFANRFRWTLTDLGYSKDFVDFATEAIVVHISRVGGSSTT